MWQTFPNTKIARPHQKSTFQNQTKSAKLLTLNNQRLHPTETYM
jgi:hypothetical protein